MASHRRDSGTSRGGLLVRVGVVLFAVGFVCIAFDVLPHPLSTEDRPLPLNLLTYLTSLGLGLALGGLVLSIRAGHRAAVRAAAEDDG